MPKGNGSPKRTKRKTSIKIKLPIKALSVNLIYGGRKRRSFQYKNYRRLVLNLLKEYDKKAYNLEGNLCMTMDVGFSSPLSDLSNAIKAIEDVVAEYFAFNDRFIVEIHMRKFLVHKGEEFIHLDLKKSRRRKIDLRLKKRKARKGKKK